MKPYIRLQVETGGLVTIEGNSEGLADLQGALDQAVSSQSGIGRTQDKQWETVRIPGRLGSRARKAGRRGASL
jgi:hypothetical protein